MKIEGKTNLLPFCNLNLIGLHRITYKLTIRHKILGLEKFFEKLRIFILYKIYLNN